MSLRDDIKRWEGVKLFPRCLIHPDVIGRELVEFEGGNNAEYSVHVNLCRNCAHAHDVNPYAFQMRHVRKIEQEIAERGQITRR